MSRPLAIDVEGMQLALEDRAGAGQWFLDTETGDVIRLSASDATRAAQIEDNIGDRYIGIPYQGAQADGRDMAEFTASVHDLRLRALLDAAIRRTGAPAHFDAVLRDVPEERERWSAFRTMCVHHRIRRWLASENIAPFAARPPAS